jgi:hypothetical protein
VDIEDSSTSAASFGQAGKVFMDLAAAALACDATRVIGISYGRGGGGPRYTFLGGSSASRDHHSISHGTGAPKSDCAPIDKWHIEQFAYLLAKLRDTSEGGARLLDNTLAVHGNEFGAWTGSQHWRKDIPFIIVGGKWYFRTGRFVKMPGSGEPHNKLLTSIVHAMGVESVANVGMTEFGTGPLPGLAR